VVGAKGSAPKAAAPKGSGEKLIAINKKAKFDYSFLDSYEAGIALRGSEVKSLRDGQVQLKDAYVSFVGHEAFLQNAHIAVHKASSYNNHEPERKRKLLLNRIELDKIQRQVEEKSLTCIPYRIYFKKGMVKVEIVIAKGKKHEDKRESIKTRDINREIATRMKRGR